MEYLSNNKSFSLEELNELDINTKINRLLFNEIYICPNCNYKDGVILDQNSKTLSKTILNWKLPKILNIGFETAKWEDVDDKNNLPDIITQNEIIFNRLKANVNNIKRILKPFIIIKDVKFNLKAIICSPYSGHFTLILIDLIANEYLLNNHPNNYYDNNNEIK